MAVRLGSEVLLTSKRLQGRRVGILCNPASVDSALLHIVDALAKAPAVRLAAVFSPQHGFRADVQDNMVETSHGRDWRHDVPVYSLYGETREPIAEMLKDIDVLVIDLQDVGARIYTFVYTMANCLRAARAHSLPVIVCDRPNPIGGDAVEGPMLTPGYESFVGQFPIPMRHGMTVGELARFFNDACGIGASLDVVAMEGWRRSMYYDDTGLYWVMPSPNMPTLDTATVYPGTVLFEGTNLSEGRGTTKPFEIVGAPWVDPEMLCRTLEAHELRGAHFRPVVFEPTFQKHARTACGGCQIHVLDRTAFGAVESGVAVLAEMRSQNPSRFEWRPPPYEYEHVRLPIDSLAGSGELRAQIEAGLPIRAIVDRWKKEIQRFRKTREPFLMYG